MTKFRDQFIPGSQDSLSAFLDNEATDADIDALLNSDIEQLTTKVDHYHQIHQSIQPDSEHLIFDSHSFLAGIHNKLEEGVDDSNVVAFPNQTAQSKTSAIFPTSENVQPTVADSERAKPKVSNRSLFSGLAVAASVAFAVVLGGNVLLSNDAGVDTPNFMASTPAEVSVEPALTNDPQISVEDNERLQSYLRQHAQQASMTVGQGMIPMAKVVSYPQGNAQ